MNIYRKLWSILDEKQRLHSLRLISLTLVSGLLEAAGVGLIVPFISIITSDNFQLPIALTNIFPYLNELSSQEIIVLAVASFVLFYFVKSLVST